MNQLQVFLPPPSNWQDFQDLIVEVARVRFLESSVQEYGRLGQAQKGIDVYAQDHLDKHIGLQCKETKKESLTTTIIDAEIIKAQQFSPALDLLIIATTARIDTKLQDHVINLNSHKAHPFRLQIWFWDDINRDINRFQSVMTSSYESFREHFGQAELKNHLAAVRLAFDRPAFTEDFLLERNYQNFESALVSIKAFLKVGVLHDNWSKTVLVQTIPSSMIGDQAYSKFITDIEKMVESIYQSFKRDQKKITSNPRQLDERAGDYNISRRKLIDKLNKRFAANAIDHIITQY
ncbi:hypothetical protein QLQ86_11225 [Halomonas sp. LR5S13]|uniref:hypothetical protein n=1 Tax=Halomonas rhizosphaerae TaxID=3043296 RepID=UPI0024A7ABC8|nr:hypothetical protein [Halomonas rhizosphaerae]MDI5921357.1 hypothetical protein [Halomonas rhizosphaerae]